MSTRHTHIFPARRDALPEVEAFLAEMCAGAGLSRQMCLRITLLVEELFTNTVVHGHGADSDAPVQLDCEVRPGASRSSTRTPARRTIPSRWWRAPTRVRTSKTGRWAGSACSSSPPWPSRSSTRGPATGTAFRS